MQNQMTQAFRNATVLPSAIGSKMVFNCIDAITNQEKRKPSVEEARGWSTKLSFKTYNELKAQGILQ